MGTLHRWRGGATGSSSFSAGGLLLTHWLSLRRPLPRHWFQCLPTKNEWSSPGCLGTAVLVHLVLLYVPTLAPASSCASPSLLTLHGPHSPTSAAATATKAAPGVAPHTMTQGSHGTSHFIAFMLQGPHAPSSAQEAASAAAPGVAPHATT